MDAFFDKIEHSTFDGLDRRTLEHITQMTHPFGLTIFGGKSSSGNIICYYHRLVLVFF